MSSYDQFAKFYDALMYDCDYEQWSQYLLSVLAKNVERGARGVDLACGSGNVTVPLARAGYEMIGTDLSEEMLRIAQEKARKNGVRILFSEADFRTFDFPKNVAFVTCVCDGLNYIPSSDLPGVFARVFDALDEGGLFAFDISSSYKLKTVLGDNLFYDDGEEVTYFWQNECDGTSVKMDLSFFVREGEKYRRFDEMHEQFLHGETEILNALNKVGFADVFACEFLTLKPTKKTSERIQFFARKGKKLSL